MAAPNMACVYHNDTDHSVTSSTASSTLAEHAGPVNTTSALAFLVSSTIIEPPQVDNQSWEETGPCHCFRASITTRTFTRTSELSSLSSATGLGANTTSNTTSPWTPPTLTPIASYMSGAAECRSAGLSSILSALVCVLCLVKLPRGRW